MLVPLEIAQRYVDQWPEYYTYREYGDDVQAFLLLTPKAKDLLKQ
jgi:hypothetical protein